MCADQARSRRSTRLSIKRVELPPESDDDVSVDSPPDSPAEEKAKPGKKKSIVRSASPALSPAAKRKKKSSADESEVEPEVNSDSEYGALYQMIMHAGGVINPSSWLTRYRKSETTDLALVDMANFLLHACGSRVTLKQNQVENEDRDDVISEAATSVVPDYPIASKHKDFKKFKSRLLEFFSKFVQQAKRELTDEKLMPFIFDWLSSLANSSLSAFRHTATEISYQIMLALTGIAKEERKHVDDTQRQFEVESKKKKPNKARVTQFSDELAEYNSSLDRIHSLLETNFEGVFVRRYRDIKPFLRTLSMNALSKWLSTYSAFFLQDKYLKYLGWCLYDKDVDTRKAALDGIILMYRDESRFGALEMFTLRFLPRIMEMIKDVDRHVATSAVQLMTILLKAGILSEKQGEDIPSLVWDDDAQLSKAAAAFSYQDIFAVAEEEKITDERQNLLNQEDIVELLKFFREYCPDSKLAIEEHLNALEVSTTTLVEAFWDHLPCLKDWSTMVRTLLSTEQSRKATSSAAAAEDRGQVVLANTLLCSARKVVALARAAKSKPSAQVKEDHTSLTTFLVSKLPELLTIFQADIVKTFPLVQLPVLFPADFFSSTQKKALRDLLGVLRAIFLKHSHPQLLDATSATFSFLCKDASSCVEANQVVREMASEMLEQFKEISDRSDVQLDDDDRLALNTCLKRIRSIYSHIHVAELSFSSEFNQLLGTHIKNNGDEQVILQLLVLHHLDLLWSVSSLPESPEADVLDTLASQQISFLAHLEDALQTGNSVLKDHAFHIIADLFTVHSSERLEASSLEPLAVRARASLKTLLCNHFESVMSEDDNEPSDNESRDKRRLEILISCCKIISSNPSQHVLLRDKVVACFNKYGEEPDKLIKLLLNKLKAHSSALLLEAQLGGLKQTFSGSSTDRLHDVANKFVVMHNLDPTKRSLLPLLRDGITFALQDDTHYLFLKALVPFVSRASSADAQAAYAHFEAMRGAMKQNVSKTISVALDEFKDMLDRKRAGKAATPARSRKRDRSGTPLTASPSTTPKGTPKTPSRKAVRRALNLTSVDSQSKSVPMTPQSVTSVDESDELDHKHADDSQEETNSSSAHANGSVQVPDEDIFEHDESLSSSSKSPSTKLSSTSSSSKSKPVKPVKRSKAHSPSFPSSKPKRKRRFN